MNFVPKFIRKRKLMKSMYKLLDLMDEHIKDEDPGLWVAYAVSCANIQKQLIIGDY